MPEDTETIQKPKQENTTTQKIEVNPSNLSEEVVQELIKEGAFDKEEAKEYGDEVWLNEIDIKSPTKKTLKTILSDKLNNCIKTAKTRTAYAKIQNVSRSEKDDVEIQLTHPQTRSGKIWLDPDSQKLANIMALKNVQNPKQLEGHKLIKPDGHAARHAQIPTNLSPYGQTKYKTAGLLRQFNKKIKIKNPNRDWFNPVSLFLVAGASFTAVVTKLTYETAPKILFTLPMPLLLITILVFLYHIIRRATNKTANKLQKDTQHACRNPKHRNV
jgi:polyhydroxyalkanoate synthesis regulator phasin